MGGRKNRREMGDYGKREGRNGGIGKGWAKGIEKKGDRRFEKGGRGGE